MRDGKVTGMEKKPRPPNGEPPPPPSCSNPSSSSARVEDSASGNVRVSARFRPANRLEQEQNAKRCVTLEGQSVHMDGEKGEKEEAFTFDAVFGETSTQEEVYNSCAKALVADVLAGYSCTIFAYGQTGSGKTHTMMGPDRGEREEWGIIPRISQDIFVAMAQADSCTEFIVKASFVEIYMERIRDLLNPTSRGQNLKIRETKRGGITLEGVEEVYVATPAELLRVAAKGAASRAIASTRMNQDSSRSHSVFILTVTQRDTRTDTSQTGKLHLVDLAGSEMVKKTQATAEVLEEAKMINKSLSALGNVIKALVEGTKHVPYRDSKLTRMLQDSLGGNSKTSLIITCSSFSYNMAETLSTLRFGSRAKKIKNRPKVNKTYSIAEYKVMLSKARETIRALGTYCRSLEGRLGMDESSSPMKSQSGDAHFTVSNTISGPSDLKSDLPTWPPPALSVPLTPNSPEPSSANSAGFDADLMRRAEEALTVALRTADTLRSRLEEKSVELKMSKETVDGQRKQIRTLEERVADLGRENTGLVQDCKDLKLFKEQAQFNQRELELTVERLESENKVLLNRLENGERLTDASEVTSSAQSPAAQRDVKHLGHDEAIVRSQKLEQDLKTITERYITLRLAHLETQEALAATQSDNVSELLNRLEVERDERKGLEGKLRSALAKLEVAHQAEVNWKMKMQNRENQINFLEEALRDFQDTFKANVEDYSQHISELQHELALYKKALDNLDAKQFGEEEDEVAASEGGVHPPMILPKVIKPVRGQIDTGDGGTDAGTEGEEAASIPRRRSFGDIESSNNNPTVSNGRFRKQSTSNWLMEGVADGSKADEIEKETQESRRASDV